MGRVRVSAVVAGPPEAVLALWEDTSRWASFVDCFRAVVHDDGEVVEWESTPAGGGRTRERRRSRTVTEVETEQYRGTRTLELEPQEGGEVRFAVSLDYTLKDRTPITPVVDRFFVRRALADSLRRTLRRFAIERQTDAAG